MRVTIEQLDQGYTVKVTVGEEKKKFAFERLEDALGYINHVFRNVEVQQEEQRIIFGEAQPPQQEGPAQF